MLMEVRDGRAMSRMDGESREVHLRLEAWARWSKDAALRPYPEATIIARMMEYGAQGASQTGKPPISMPEPIAVVDAAVAHLCQIDQRAVKEYYLRWQPVEISARRMHKSVRQFQAILQRARWRLSLNLRASLDG